MRGVKTLLGISRLEARQRGVARGDEEMRQQSASVGKGMELIGGPLNIGQVGHFRTPKIHSNLSDHGGTLDGS
jgi:hypothetical protein